MMTDEKELLRMRVETLLGEVETTHRYSMSRIYGLWNEVFGKEEKPQSCASCLIRKVHELKAWFGEQPEQVSAPVEKPKRKRAKK